MSLLKQAIDRELARRRRASLMDPQDSSKAIRQGLEAARTKTSPNKPMKYLDVPREEFTSRMLWGGPKNKIIPENKRTGTLPARELRGSSVDNLRKKLQGARSDLAYEDRVDPGMRSLKRSYPWYMRDRDETIHGKTRISHAFQKGKYLSKAQKSNSDKYFNYITKLSPAKQKEVSTKVDRSLGKKVPYIRTHELTRPRIKRRASSLKTAKKNMPAVRKSLGLLRKIK